MAREAGAVAEYVFDCEVGRPVRVSEDEVGRDEGVDRRWPVDGWVVVDEEGECCGGEGFGRAAGVEECLWCDGLGGESGEAEAPGVGGGGGNDGDGEAGDVPFK